MQAVFMPILHRGTMVFCLVICMIPFYHETQLCYISIVLQNFYRYSICLIWIPNCGFIICFNKLSSDVHGCFVSSTQRFLFLSHVLDGHYISLCFFFIDPESIVTGIALILVICLLGATMLTIEALVAYTLQFLTSKVLPQLFQIFSWFGFTFFYKFYHNVEQHCFDEQNKLLKVRKQLLLSFVVSIAMNCQYF